MYLLSGMGLMKYNPVTWVNLMLWLEFTGGMRIIYHFQWSIEDIVWLTKDLKDHIYFTHISSWLCHLIFSEKPQKAKRNRPKSSRKRSEEEILLGSGMSCLNHVNPVMCILFWITVSCHWELHPSIVQLKKNECEDEKMWIIALN